MAGANGIGRRLLPWIALAAAIVLIDQLTKVAIERAFDYGDVRPVTGWLWFSAKALMTSVLLSWSSSTTTPASASQAQRLNDPLEERAAMLRRPCALRRRRAGC